MKTPEILRSVLRANAVPTVLFGALLVAALVYLDEVHEWFALSTSESAESAASHADAMGEASKSHASISVYPFPDAARTALEGAFADYEKAREVLAADGTDGLATHGGAIAEWIRRASAALEGPPDDISRTLLAAGTAAERLSASSTLEEARAAFGELSRTLVTLATADPRLQEGKKIFECSMFEGYGRWIQLKDERENPYMGQAMLTCGSSSEFAASPGGGQVSPAGQSHEGHGHDGDDPAHYTCSMHPSVEQSEPGTCPICAMNLTPVTFDEEEGGVIFVDAVRRQRIGVRIGEVAQTSMVKRIRTVGKLTYDESKLHDISLKYDGWVQKLYANKLGMRVERGAPLFAAYSPDLYAAQGDLIVALEGPSLPGAGDLPGGRPLVGIARERLRLLDAYGLEAHLKKTGQPVRYITVSSPAQGYIVEKNVVDGSAFKAGTRVMRIAGLDTVWLEAELYESELPLVKVGQHATIRLAYVPGVRQEGEITYVYPYLDPKTRTGKARIELANPDLVLKPDMYANVTIDVELGERLSVPDSAVLYTGRRRLVFVDLGEGRLRPSIVTLGVHADGRYEVLSGLEEGDKVVTSGNFLVAAESRIRSAARYWGEADEGASSAPEDPPPPSSPAPPPASSAPEPRNPRPSGHSNRAPAKPAPAEAPSDAAYACPMHSEITSHEPGTCSVCGMALTPGGN